MRSLPADVRACRGGKTLFPRRKTFSVSRGRAELRPETAEAGKCLFRGTVRAGRGPNGVECGLCRGGVDDFGAVVFLKTVRGISAVRRRRQDCRETFGRVQSAAERTAAFAFAISGERRKVDRKEKIFYRQPFSAPPLHTCTRCVSISFCCRSFCGRLGASSGVHTPAAVVYRCRRGIVSCDSFPRVRRVPFGSCRRPCSPRLSVPARVHAKRTAFCSCRPTPSVPRTAAPRTPRACPAHAAGARAASGREVLRPDCPSAGAAVPVSRAPRCRYFFCCSFSRSRISVRRSSSFDIAGAGA